MLKKNFAKNKHLKFLYQLQDIDIDKKIITNMNKFRTNRTTKTYLKNQQHDSTIFLIIQSIRKQFNIMTRSSAL